MLIARRTFIVGAAAAAGCAPRTGALTLEDVLARHTEARGGRAALDAVRTLRTDAQVSEATFSVNGPYIANTDGLMRVDIFSEGQCVFSEGIDRDGAWSWDPGADVQPASPQGEAALRHGVEFNVFGLHRFAERGHTLTLEGVEEVGEIAYHVIKVVMNDGFETFRFIDPVTWMIARSRDVRAIHPDADATEAQMESEYSDFRDVSGVRSAFAWLQRNLSTGEIVQRGVVASLEYNIPLDVDTFARTRRA